jgi:hypothetical protein
MDLSKIAINRNLSKFTYKEEDRVIHCSGKNTLETSGKDVEVTLETSGEDVKLHSRRVYFQLTQTHRSFARWF